MKQLQHILKNGAEGYTPSVMWFTGGNINKKEMTRQIEGFQKQNIQDFFIHPVDDTWGGYLSEYHFDMIRHAADEAKRLGMHFWIYDEYKWPSGTAGGQVLEKEPWTIGTCLSRAVKTAAPGETVTAELPDQGDYEPQVLLTAADGKVLEGTGLVWKNETDHAADFEVYYISRMLRKVDCLVGSEFNKPETKGYLDVMNPKAVDVFVSMTHERYKEHIGEGFGKHVKGVFTDEVATMLQPFGEKRPEHPWTPDFEKKFFERNGYEIRPRVKDLLDRTDAKLTVDYWETVSELFMAAYMDITQQWCESNGLIYIGHMLAEELMELVVHWGADPYEYYKRFTWPGIDSIVTYHRLNHYFFNIPGKQVASAARFLGKERILCETFTLSAWDMRLRDMKRAVHRLALLGVDFIQYMGAKYDFEPGKECFAMTNNWQNPLFCHYEELSRYVSGIQWLVANTEYDAHTLLFYPITTARATLPVERPAAAYCLDRVLTFTWGGLINSLLDLNVPYEIGFEQVMDDAEVENGVMRIAGSDYKTIILPTALYLKEKTFRQLEKFAEGGGKIIAVNGQPSKIIGKDSIYDAPQLKNVVICDCLEYEMYPDEERKTMGVFTETLRQALGEMDELVELTPQVGLLSALRRKGDARYMMLVNDSDTEITAEGKVCSDLPFTILCAESGEEKPFKVEGKSFAVDLCPYECAVLVLSEEVCHGENKPAEIGREIPLTNAEFSISGSNTARPDLYLVRGEAAKAIIAAQKRFNPKRVCDLAEKLRAEDMIPCVDRKNRFLSDKAPKTDWYGCCPKDGTKLLPGETIVCVYDFQMDEMPPVLELVSEPQHHPVWFLNGQELYQTGVKRLWHYANTAFDLETVAKVGKNRLVCVCTVPDYDGDFLPPAAALVGDYRFFDDCVLTQKPGGKELTYWNGQGYRCYSGEGVYTAEFTVTEGPVVLELVTTDVAEVWVNGSFVAKRLWDPYKVELTGFVKPGVNKLEVRVTSTLSNFISNANPSGIKEMKLYTE